MLTRKLEKDLAWRDSVLNIITMHRLFLQYPKGEQMVDVCLLHLFWRNHTYEV
jgi:hypothetical protein